MKNRGSPWFLTGGVIAALAASLCCIGPLLSLSLGLGSFAASAWFSEWRPLLLATTFLLLGLAWWLDYRRSRADCPDGKCARPPGRAARISLWLGTLVALAFAIYPSLPTIRPAAATGTATNQGEKFSVRIPSMDCPPCAVSIEGALRRTPGVLQATVNYDSKRTELVFDPLVTNRTKLLAFIDGTGFPADRSTLK